LIPISTLSAKQGYLIRYHKGSFIYHRFFETLN
jgi:hypothetical protein